MNLKLRQKKEDIKSGYPFNICYPIMNEKITISEVNPPFDCVNEVNTSKCKDHTYRMVLLQISENQMKNVENMVEINRITWFGGNYFQINYWKSEKCKTDDDIRFGH